MHCVCVCSSLVRHPPAHLPLSATPPQPIGEGGGGGGRGEGERGGGRGKIMV